MHAIRTISRIKARIQQTLLTLEENFADPIAEKHRGQTVYFLQSTPMKPAIILSNIA